MSADLLRQLAETYEQTAGPAELQAEMAERGARVANLHHTAVTHRLEAAERFRARARQCRELARACRAGADALAALETPGS